MLNHGELEKRLLNSEINIIALDESKLSGLLLLWKLTGVIHHILPDVIHTHRLEAMASGTAIIAHAVGGIPNLLNQGECGILVTENKPANFALAINI